MVNDSWICDQAVLYIDRVRRTNECNNGCFCCLKGRSVFVHLLIAMEILPFRSMISRKEIWLSAYNYLPNGFARTKRLTELETGSYVSTARTSELLLGR